MIGEPLFTFILGLPNIVMIKCGANGRVAMKSGTQFSMFRASAFLFIRVNFIVLSAEIPFQF